MSLILNNKLKFYLSKKVLLAALSHTLLVFLAGYLIQNYFLKQEKANFLQRSQEIFKSNKSQIEQEIYINSVIQETDNSNLSAVRNFLSSLKTIGFDSEMRFVQCTNESRFTISSPNNHKNICFDLIIKNDFAERTSKLFYPLIIIFFLTSLPIYFILLNTMKKESLLQFKSDIIDEFRHNVNSPLIALQSYIDSKESELPQSLVKEIRSKVATVKSHLQETEITKQKSVETINLMRSLEIIIEDKRLEIASTSKKISIELESLDKISLVSFNKTDFASIISNLLNNSINAIEEKGDIRVSLLHHEAEIKIIIKDNGKGVDNNHIPRLFKKGFTLNTVGGTGSGLYQAKYKLEQKGSSISLSSVVGVGTTVTITFPKTQNLLQEEKKVVFILEDDEILNIGYKSAIKKNNLSDRLNISFFKTTDSLIENLNELKDTIFILDSQIGENKIAGVELSKTLQSKGYKELYIHSSYSAQNFEQMPHIKGILKKESSNDLILFLQGLVHGIN